jgi:hypothetical protein
MCASYIGTEILEDSIGGNMMETFPDEAIPVIR